MPNGTYLLTIDQKHEFEMICKPQPHPTQHPTDPLTTANLTVDSFVNPTDGPTTSYPTMQVIVVNVSFSAMVLSDLLGRLECSINYRILGEEL